MGLFSSVIDGKIKSTIRRWRWRIIVALLSLSVFIVFGLIVAFKILLA